MHLLKFSLKSLNIRILQIYIHFIKTIFYLLNIKISIFFLPKKLKKITLLKSPHVYKKAREQFEQKKYKVVLIAQIVKKNHISNLLKLLIFNKPLMICLKVKINYKNLCYLRK